MNALKTKYLVLSAITLLYLILFFILYTQPRHTKDLQIIKRSDWAKYEIDKNQLKPNNKISHISIHHSAWESEAEEDEPEVQLNKMLYKHSKEKNWGDIAYHYLIAKDGMIYQGRDVSYAANSSSRYLPAKLWKKNKIITAEEARAVPKNPIGGTEWVSNEQTGPAPGEIQGHLTICFLGNFEKVDPTFAAKKAFINLSEYLIKKYGLTLNDIWAHREIASSKCPGNKLFLWLRDPKKGRYGFGPALMD